MLLLLSSSLLRLMLWGVNLCLVSCCLKLVVCDVMMMFLLLLKELRLSIVVLVLLMWMVFGNCLLRMLSDVVLKVFGRNVIEVGLLFELSMVKVVLRW